MWCFFKFFSITCFYFFPYALLYILLLFICVMCLFIYFYIYYNTNFINREHFSYKDGTLFCEPRILSLLNKRKNILSSWDKYSWINFYLNISMWDLCFKGFIARNMIVQSEFNLNAWFSCYGFFYLKNALYILMSAIYTASAGAWENYCWCASATASAGAWLLSSCPDSSSPRPTPPSMGQRPLRLFGWCLPPFSMTVRCNGWFDPFGMKNRPRTTTQPRYMV
jgi:hypothetical protein